MNIVSPFNYTGGKRRLLPFILGKVVDNWNIGEYGKCLDMFAGGGSVGINIPCKQLYMNDIEKHMTDFYEYVISNNLDEMLGEIDFIINKYKPTEEKGYYDLRSYYNKNKTPLGFFVLSCHSFNYMVRFNPDDEFNAPHGKRRYGDSIRKRFINFVKEMKRVKPIITNKDFRELDLSNFKMGDIVYADPPYLISDANYNAFWTEKEDCELYEILTQIDKQGCKFALSNVFENKGMENKILKEFAKNYNVLYNNIQYSNCSYNRSYRMSPTVEVLITNF